MNKLLLASTSPTRKKILINAGIKVLIKKPLINEEKEKEKLKNIKIPEKICRILAKKKAILTSLKYTSYFVLGVDTCLIYKKKFFIKTKNKRKSRKFVKKIKW